MRTILADMNGNTTRLQVFGPLTIEPLNHPMLDEGEHLYKLTATQIQWFNPIFGGPIDYPMWYATRFECV